MKRKMVLLLLSGLLAATDASIVYCEPDMAVTDINSEDYPIDAEQEIITSTDKDEENSCQITFNAKIPDEFGLDVYIQFQNEDTGRTYQIIAYKENGYSDHMYVPPGKYLIAEVGIWKDVSNKYPMTMPGDFEVSENEPHTISSELTAYEDIETKIADRKGDNEEDEEAKEEESEDDHPAMLPWRNIEHKGLKAGWSPIEILGWADKEVDLIVKITNTGSYKQAAFDYSVDGGKSWVSEGNMRKGEYPLIGNTSDGNSFDTGLSIRFDESGDSNYCVGDEYRIHIDREIPVKSRSSGGAAVYVTKKSLSETALEDGTIIMEDIRFVDKVYDIEIIINDDGTFSYSLDGGTSFFNDNEEYDIPVYPYSFEIPDTPFKVQFCSYLGDFKRGDTFNIHLEPEKAPVNKTLLLIAAAVVIIMIIAVVYGVLLGKKEKDSDYTLNVYTPVKTRTPEKSNKQVKMKINKAKTGTKTREETL